MDYSWRRAGVIQAAGFSVFCLAGAFVNGSIGFASGALIYFTCHVIAISAFVFAVINHHAYKEE